MSGHIDLRGMLCFTNVDSLERAKRHLAAPIGSLLRPDCLTQCHLAVTFDASTLPASASAKSWTATWGALFALDDPDARGAAWGTFDEDAASAESTSFARTIAAPSAHRASSTAWSALRPPPAPAEFSARFETSVIHVIYALSSQSEQDGPQCPSFVLGPLPDGIMAGGADWDAFAGSMLELEVELNKHIARQSDPQVVMTLMEALAWVQARPESDAMQVQEPPEWAGDGTSRPRAFGRITPGFVDEGDPDEAT